jgi:hypothetical protein
MEEKFAAYKRYNWAGD